MAAGLGAAIVPGLALSWLNTDGVTVYTTATDIGTRVVTLTGPHRNHRSSSAQRVQEVFLEIVAAGSVRSTV